MYIYRSHIGDAYWTDDRLADNELVCSVCGGKDECIGQASTVDEFVDIVNSANIRISALMEKKIEQMFEGGLRVSSESGIISLSKVNKTC